MTVFCRDCKHRIPSPTAPRYDTCALYMREQDSDYLVTGEGENRTLYHYCTIIRQSDEPNVTFPDRCGLSGTRFERRLEVA